MKLTLSKIGEVLSAVGDFPSDEVAQAYSIDSRTIGTGALFFAVKGERLDGHAYVEAARQKGAVGAVVEKAELHRYLDKDRLLAVDDNPAALQTLFPSVSKTWSNTLLRVTGYNDK